MKKPNYALRALICVILGVLGLIAGKSDASILLVISLFIAFESFIIVPLARLAIEEHKKKNKD